MHLSEPEMQLGNVLRSCKVMAREKAGGANRAGEAIRCAGRGLQVPFPLGPLSLRRDTLPAARQWPEAFTPSSCPEMQPLHAHLCVIRVIKGR